MVYSLSPPSVCVSVCFVCVGGGCTGVCVCVLGGQPGLSSSGMPSTCFGTGSLIGTDLTLDLVTRLLQESSHLCFPRVGTINRRFPALAFLEEFWGLNSGPTLRQQGFH